MRNIFVAVMALVFCICFGCAAQAKSAPSASHKTSAGHKTSANHKTSDSHRAAHAAATVATARSAGKRAKASKSVSTGSQGKHAARLAGKSLRRRTVAGAHRGRHQRTAVAWRRKSTRVAHATRYAYPMGFFMLNSPNFDRSPLARDTADDIARSFNRGFADEYAARSLVRAGVVNYHPLHGGIFWRREPIKYIIIHSTETGIPVSAVNVINGWNSNGRRHPGAQYVVDRDGTIYQAVDPDLATVHINIFKTLPGINNDNSIGIEMNHTGRQDYPVAEREAVIRLVTYLQERYKVPDQNVITHRYAQQGDHTDPVNFDWEGFLASKNSFKNHAIAYKVNKMKDEVKHWTNVDTSEQSPPAYLQPHKALKEEQSTPAAGSTSATDAPAPETLTPTTPAPAAPTPAAPTSLTPAPTTPAPATPTPAAPAPATTHGTAPPATAPSTAPPTIMMTPSPEVPLSPKSVPPLRGPIEMEPETAPALNTLPARGPSEPGQQ